MGLILCMCDSEGSVLGEHNRLIVSVHKPATFKWGSFYYKYRSWLMANLVFFSCRSKTVPESSFFRDIKNLIIKRSI
jgi:hypothetical protein